MKKLKYMLVFALVLSLCGCGNAPAQADAASPVTASKSTEQAQSAQPLRDSSGMFSDRDFETDYDESACVLIELSPQGVKCDSALVGAEGGTVTISGEGSYILRGELEGMVIVDAGNTDKVQLILDGANISSESSAAIYVRRADKLFITSAPGSENHLSNSGVFRAIDDNNIDGIIFSKDDVTINGSGSIYIDSPGGHGLVVKDSLCITGGTLDINAASNGIEAKDDFCAAAGCFVIQAGKDAIQSDNDDDEQKGFVYISGGEFSLAASDDGISATGYVKISDGSFEISCGGGIAAAELPQSGGMGQGAEPPMNGQPPQGGQPPMNGEPPQNGGMGRGKGGGMSGPGADFAPMSIQSANSDSMRAIRAGADIIIQGGSFRLDSSGDAIHSNALLDISGGEFEIYAGDDALNGEDSIIVQGGAMKLTAYGDGLDSNGSIEISGGEISVCGPLHGDTSTLDFESSAVITGGSFYGSGSSMMARTFSSSTQGLLSLQTGNQSAGTSVTVSDSQGREIISFTPELDFCVVIISDPRLEKGESYTVTVGSVSGELTA